MCYQLIELYSACRCLYYQYAIDKCPEYGRHPVKQRTVYVGYACSVHTGPSNSYSIGKSAIASDDDMDTGDNTDTASLFSELSIGSAATSVTVPSQSESDLAEQLFQSFLSEPELQFILPQLVRVSRTRSKAEKSLTRFLQRLARDLRTAAATKTEFKISSFVRYHRHKISRRIVEYHIKEVNGDTPEPEGEDAPLLELPQAEEEGSDAEDDDFIILFDELHKFLFEGASFQSFKNNLQLFLTKSYHVTDKRYTFEKVTNIFSNGYSCFTSKYYGLNEQAKTKRLWWTCPCGCKLYDDYEELRPGALDELRVFLAQYAPPIPTEIEASQTSNQPPTQHQLTQSLRVSHLTGTLMNFFNPAQKERLPQHQRDSTDLTDCVALKYPPIEQLAHKFLLLCIPFMKWGAKLQQPDVCRIYSDRDFFQLLRKSYLKHRSGYPWRWLKSISKVEFVQFEMFSNDLVDISASPSMPSRDARQDYDYEQSDTNPPIGYNMLMHLLENPSHAPILPILFKKIPVKRRTRLAACPQKGFSCGWGVQFIESSSTLAIFSLGLIGFILSLVASILWTAVRNDVQGGFGIGAFVLAFFLFCATQFHLIS